MKVRLLVSPQLHCACKSEVQTIMKVVTKSVIDKRALDNESTVAQFFTQFFQILYVLVATEKQKLVRKVVTCKICVTNLLIESYTYFC